jgi:Nitroreductase family
MTVRRGGNNSMDFNEVFKKRKMIRKYDSKQVSDETIKKLIRNELKAPSAGHTQVQEFIIVKDSASKCIHSGSQKWFRFIYLFASFCTATFSFERLAATSS